MRVPVRIIVPRATWQPDFDGQGTELLIEANERSGLDADSAGNFLRVRSVPVERVVERIRRLATERQDRLGPLGIK